ncbi:hypothetical protein LOK49_Contig3G00020 [Camellia lanceoleosa]|nr:hypothetical protein LOK49_Contig3G00020 [Camellia lanceoleosa]
MEKYPIVVVAEVIEQEALAPIIRNKLRGILKAAAIKAPAFGERKSHYLDDIAILTGGTVIRDDMGLTLEKARKEVLGTATKVVITKDSTLIVTDGSTQAAVKKRVSQIQKLVETNHFDSAMSTPALLTLLHQMRLPGTNPCHYQNLNGPLTPLKSMITIHTQT